MVFLTFRRHRSPGRSGTTSSYSLMDAVTSRKQPYPLKKTRTQSTTSASSHHCSGRSSSEKQRKPRHPPGSIYVTRTKPQPHPSRQERASHRRSPPALDLFGVATACCKNELVPSVIHISHSFEHDEVASALTNSDLLSKEHEQRLSQQQQQTLDIEGQYQKLQRRSRQPTSDPPVFSTQEEPKQQHQIVTGVDTSSAGTFWPPSHNAVVTVLEDGLLCREAERIATRRDTMARDRVDGLRLLASDLACGVPAARGEWPSDEERSITEPQRATAPPLLCGVLELPSWTYAGGDEESQQEHVDCIDDVDSRCRRCLISDGSTYEEQRDDHEMLLVPPTPFSSPVLHNRRQR